MTQSNLKNRILKGIKFFRQLETRDDKELFRKYWRAYLDLVEKYFEEAEKEDSNFTLAQEILGAEEEK